MFDEVSKGGAEHELRDIYQLRFSVGGSSFWNLGGVKSGAKVLGVGRNVLELEVRIKLAVRKLPAGVGDTEWYIFSKLLPY